MKKSDLVVALAKETELSLSKSKEIVNLVFRTMYMTLVGGDRIEVRGFGSFEVREYGSYMGRNPKTGKKIAVKKKRLPFFKAGKDLKENADRKSES